VPVAFGRYLLLPALPEFVRRYPAIDLDIRLNDRVVDLVAERVDVALRVGTLQQAGLVARRVAQMNIVTCASPTYLADHGEPQTPDDLGQHRLLALSPPGGGSPEWSFPAPYSAKRLKLHFAMQFNSAEAPIIAAAAGLGITHTADLLVAEYVGRGELKLILEKYVLPGAPISLVYPSAGHQSPKVRVFSDFAAELLRRWHGIVQQWLQAPSPTKSPAE
jgi:LysR family transcriptional regulator for bpeEF and oprC